MRDQDRQEADQSRHLMGQAQHLLGQAQAQKTQKSNPYTNFLQMDDSEQRLATFIYGPTRFLYFNFRWVVVLGFALGGGSEWRSMVGEFCWICQ